MHNPLLSILVPVYNIDRYIGLCLESLLNQSYTNLEILVVDDGSTDRSGEICDLYAKKDQRIRVIHKPNGGLVSARKAAMKEAKGEIIGYVDGDDYVDYNYFKEMVMSMMNTQADCVISGYNRDIFNKSVRMNNILPAKTYQGDDLAGMYSNMISTGDFFCHGVTTYLWNKIFKREVIYHAQMDVDERITIGEDGATTYPALLQCNVVTIIDTDGYHYRQREDSMLKTSDNYNAEAEKLSVLYYYLKNAFSDKPTAYRLQSQVNDYLLSTFIIRSGGIGNDAASIINDKNVAIYGAGTFGQQLVKRLRHSNWSRIAIWVDEDYWEYRRCCMDVDELDCLIRADFDYVLIGMINGLAIKRAKKKLIAMGVEESKILSVTDFVNIKGDAITNYLTY